MSTVFSFLSISIGRQGKQYRIGDYSYLVSPNPMSYQEAKVFCADLDGNLANIGVRDIDVRR